MGSLTDGAARLPAAVGGPVPWSPGNGTVVPGGVHRRPEPVKFVTIKKVSGAPDPAHISLSYVERQSLTIRMSMRRFTRLTNAFSKKLENLTAAGSLHFMFYNFARPHMTPTKRYGKPTTPRDGGGQGRSRLVTD